MAIDITTIGIEYDTSGLIAGTNAQNQTTASANQLGNAVSGTERRFGSFAKTIAIAATAMAAIGSVALAKQFIEIGDAVTLMDARLKLAVGSSQDFAKAQKDIYAIAQANNVGLQETTALYTKLYEPVKRLGGSTKEATAIVDAFATSLRVGGAGAQEAASATLQFAQAMGSGKLQGDEFRSMAEASPRFMKALAEGMGVPIEKLKEMGSEGKLTADVVGNALIKSLDKLKQEALSLPDTVGGSLTRFKNDIIVAVGEINNSEGFSVGFAGMIEGARQLIPTIKDELAGALSKVSEWFSWIKDDVLEVWDNVKGLIGDVWNLAKPFVEITAIIAGAIIKTGVFGDLLKMARVMVAGLYDGFTFIGGVLAGIGSKIMQFVLSPLTYVLEKSAQIAGVFNEDLANKIRGVNKNISDFTGAGSEYAASVVDAFGRGDSALMRLDKSLKEGAAQTKEVTKATIDASGGYAALAGSVANTEKKTKGLTIAEQALNVERTQGYKLGLEMAKDFDKSMEQFAKDQINRTKEVTKSIIDSISEQGKNYLSLKTKLDQYTDSLNESNELSKLEMSLIGSSNSERQIAIEQYKIALTLKKQLAEIDKKNSSQGEKNILIQEAQTAANLAKSQVELKVQQTEWTSFFSDIYTGLSDSLYRSFESGKGFAKTFIDSLKNLFKTNVIKIAVQAVMGGGLSLSGLANAETGAGSSGGMGGVLSYLSMGKSIYEGFSSGFSGFGNSVANYVQAGLDKAGLSMTSGGNSAFATGAGTVASYGAGIAAGVYGGRAISAGYGSNSTVNVGTALGAILGGPVGAAIGGAIGGGLNRLFGMKAKEITSQTVSGSLGGNLSYGETTFQKGGIFRSDKYGSSSTSLQSKDADLFNGLNSAYDALKASTGSFATALGLNADVILSRSDAINFSIGKTKEETQKAIETAFLSISDAMALSLIPSIASMTKEGETASQALQRVAISFSAANSVFANLNLQLFSVNDAGYKASATFIDLVGGLEGLQSVTQSYYDTYFTESEKTQKILEALTSEFEKQNLVLPKTRDGYRAMVEELSRTGTPEQLASVLKLNEAFASVVKNVEKIASTADQQYLAQRKLEVASIEASQALDQQAKATAALARETELKTYNETADALLRAGKVAELMAANYSLNQIDFGAYVSNGSFNAGGFNSQLIRQRAKTSIELANKASEDAINVEDITGVLSNLFSFTKGREFANELRRDLNLNSGFQNDIGYVMFDFIEASLTGTRLKDFAARGKGVAGVIAADEDIGYQSELQSAYARSLNQANELLRLNIITQDEYTVSLNQANEMMKDQIVDIEKLNEAYRQAGIDSVAFYFNKIGDAVAKLNEEAAKASEPIALITSAIGRFTSISDVFGLSSKAAGTVGSNAELVSQSAAIAAQILTTQSAQAAAKVLAEKASFAGSSSTQLRDFSLLVEGVKKFDPQSLEKGFLRISDALNKGSITQGQYTDLFNTSVGIFNGADEEIANFNSSMKNLSSSMGSFADSILVDSNKTTLSLSATRNELMRQYDVAKILASTGDTQGISQFQNVANQLLDVGKYATREEYNVAFGKIYGDARNLETLGSRNVNNGENVVAQLKASDEKADARIAKLEESLLFALSAIMKNTDETVTEVRGLSIT